MQVSRICRVPAACDRSPPLCIYTAVNASLVPLQLPQSVIERAQAGELRAFEQIYRRLERPLYTLALRLLGDAEAARDVLHDAMLKAFQRIGQYRNDAPFWVWLRRIAVNEALMRLRGKRTLVAEIDPDSVIDDAPAPWVHADAATLERALNRLPALTRSVLWLYHVEGYSHPEIGDLMGKTASFSKSQLARGTARLRAMLESPEETLPCLMQTPLAG